MKLFLASKSASRRVLLEEARIPFSVIEQHADEHLCDWGLPIEQLVLTIAEHKLHHARLPKGNDGDEVIIITADTLLQDAEGNIYGKPDDRTDAVRQLRALRGGLRVATGMWVEKRQFTQGNWVSREIAHVISGGTAVLSMSDSDIEQYLDTVSYALTVAGSLLVEGYGAQFVREVHGSWTGMLGLPLPELREILLQFGMR